VELRVAGHRGDDDLDLIAHVLREERAQRTVDQPGNQDGLVAGAAFAAHEAAGDAARGVEAFLEVHAEREEVDALAGCCTTHRAQHERVAGAHCNGAPGQLRQSAALDNNLAAADGDAVRMFLHVNPLPLCDIVPERFRDWGVLSKSLLRSLRATRRRVSSAGATPSTPLPNSCASQRRRPHFVRVYAL